MVRQAKIRIYKSHGKHMMYLSKAVIDDSAFPFSLKDRLIVRIEGEKLVIEREKEKEPK